MNREMEDQEAVLAANDSFYAAFKMKDAAAMRAVWADRPETVCIHPGWDALYGFDAVIESWLGILSNPNAPGIECQNARAFVIGDVAYVICHEIVPDGILAATNHFVRDEDGAWRMIHHQASPMAVAPREETPPPRSRLH